MSQGFVVDYTPYKKEMTYRMLSAYCRDMHGTPSVNRLSPLEIDLDDLLMGVEIGQNLQNVPSDGYDSVVKVLGNGDFPSLEIGYRLVFSGFVVI